MEGLGFSLLYPALDIESQELNIGNTTRILFQHESIGFFTA